MESSTTRAQKHFVNERSDFTGVPNVFIVPYSVDTGVATSDDQAAREIALNGS